MNRIFADSSFYVALMIVEDDWHVRARSFLQTYYILLELGGFFSRGRLRTKFVDLVNGLTNSRSTEIEPASMSILQTGLDLFASRPDKEWSLTDCISFAVMERHGITDALSSDHHFEQAGFRSVLMSK